MPSKSILVLCDTGVIIEAFRTSSWDILIEKYDILISQAIVDEIYYYKDDAGNKHDIVLSGYVSANKIKVVDVTYSETIEFKNKYNPVYFEKLDSGELSLLCVLFKDLSQEFLICSGDAIVYKVLGKQRCSEKGISLEELLQKAGFTKPLKQQFKKQFRENYSQQGLSDSFL
ncbi:MAG: hypothetical protein LHV68_09430 [Elusimicrobia bacterium]|nr:hypothetical protein [Candidatus Liberimonas magnetica]